MSTTYLQRRYLVNFETSRLSHVFTDVLVVGAGVAGLRAALAASENADVIIVSKEDIQSSNSFKAQGGMAAAIADDDSIEKHITDTLGTACGLGDEEVIRQVISDAPAHVKQMIEWGVGFDTEDGHLALGREGGHSKNRIVHANGDATGKVLVEVLTSRAEKNDRVKVWPNCHVLDLVTDPPEGGVGCRCLGALTYHKRFGLQLIRAKRVIFAAGGAGMLWRESTNSHIATADAIAICFRAGLGIADAEMMQFHPTTLYVAGATRSLISEAVRGEGAYLLDRNGERFMQQYDSAGELAPRDVVSRAILTQMGKTNSAGVLLDVRHIGAGRFAKRFPSIDRICRRFEIDPGRDLIPVHPAAHYMIGGVKVDIDGRTDAIGLFACGEAACTGLHGANRLASNSLLETLVFGKRCGEIAGKEAAADTASLAAWNVSWKNPNSSRSELDLADIRNSLRSVMWRNVGIKRRGDLLADTLDIVNFWGKYVLDKKFYNPAGWEIQNMLTGAYIITECALRRTETRGVHFREDFPKTDPLWKKHLLARRTKHELIVE